MNIEKIENQYNKALELKQRGKYASSLKTELSKPEWRQEMLDISERLKSIGSNKDFEKCKSQLIDLFDKIYEKITAPGLESFVNWVEINTSKISEENITKFKAFLKKDYETYSSSIDAILSAKEDLPQGDDLLFSKLMSDFGKKLKSSVNKFIKDYDSFENNIDSFLSEMKDEYTGMANIEELSFTSIEELFTDEQKKMPNIHFYDEIIQKTIDEGQELTPIDDNETKITLARRTSFRIASIKKCIATLVGTNVANLEDDDLKNLFLRYEKAMLHTDGDEKDIAKILSIYISKTWTPFKEQYEDIRNFYEELPLSFEESEWAIFDKSADITALVSDYLSVRSGNVLPKLSSSKIEDVAKMINSCHTKISNLCEKENNSGKIVREYFGEFASTYESKKILLDKLIEKHPELKEKYDTIYSKCIKTINNGIDTIKSDNTFLNALNDGDIGEMINDMNKIKTTFLEILKGSQMEKEIDWLDSLGTEGIISESNFKPDYLLELLKNGLITLSFSKEF